MDSRGIQYYKLHTTAWPEPLLIKLRKNHDTSDHSIQYWFIIQHIIDNKYHFSESNTHIQSFFKYCAHCAIVKSTTENGYEKSESRWSF